LIAVPFVVTALWQAEQLMFAWPAALPECLAWLLAVAEPTAPLV
jgi:hypothetical protein